MRLNAGTLRLALAVIAAVVVTAALATLLNRTVFAPAAVESDGAAGRVASPASPPPDPDASADPAPAAVRATPEPVPDAGPEDRPVEEPARPDPDHAHPEAGPGGESGPGAETMPEDRSADGKNEPMPRLCVIAEGEAAQLYWQFVEHHARQAAPLIGVELEFFGHPDPGQRAAMIGRCAESGADMILATLADAATIVPALQAASEQGVGVASFGAGAGHADDAGSLIHVALNWSAAGRRAAEQFDRAGASGSVVCLAERAAPDSRREICSGLDAHYGGGDVIVRQLGEGEPAGQIADLLAGISDPAGLLVLDADLLPSATRAMRQLGVFPVLGSVGEYPLRELEFQDRDLIAFTVMDLARFEVLLAAAALRYMHAHHPNARFFEGAMLFDGVPNVHTGGAKGGHERPGAEGAHSDREGQTDGEDSGNSDDHDHDH